MIRLPNSWVIYCVSNCKTIETFVDEIFPNIQHKYLNHFWLAERAILTPTNKQMHQTNNIALQNLSNASNKLIHFLVMTEILMLIHQVYYILKSY